MSSKDNNNINKRRLTGSFITTIISVSLVLFLMGLVGLLGLNATRLSTFVKENIGFSIFVKETMKEPDINLLQRILNSKKWVKDTRYISKEEAAEELKKELGEDFVQFLGYNPLSASVDVHLYADYANTDSVKNIEKEILALPQVKELVYQESLIHLVNENVERISFVLVLFSSLMFLIAITLMNNAIRLAVYAKRFIINTMQLVGATRGFIRRPFLYRSILHGLISSFIAIGMLSAIIYMGETEMEGLVSFRDVDILMILFGSVVLLGIIINLISTFFAVNKYLNIKVDNLYY